jgi:type III pantothenate kinase
MILLVELGHSSVKIQSEASLNQGEASERFFYLCETDLLEGLAVRLDSCAVAGFDRVYVVSVLSNTVNARVEQLVASMLSLRPFLLTAPLANVPFLTRYDTASLGVDRWLHLLGLEQADAPQGHLVVSAGTAMTLDYVDTQGVHLGGFICPGLQLAQDCLLNRGARLRELFYTHQADDKDVECEWPVNTYEAMVCGGLRQACAIVETTYLGLSASGSVRLVITGGDAAKLSKALHVAHVVRPGLLFEGLLKISQRFS